MRPYRENRKRMLKLYAGADWSENAADLRRPLNLIGMYVTVVSRSLVNQTPRQLLTTTNRQFRRDVWTAQQWGNRQFEKMDLGASIHRWVLDALFWLGIMKVGITTPVDSERKGFEVWAGEGFAETVDPDDYVCDVFARTWQELPFEGNRFRAPVDTANRLYKLYGTEKLEAGSPQTHNDDGDERVGIMGRGYEAGTSDEWRDMCDLWEVYSAPHRAILTFRSSDGASPRGQADLIEAREYIGPYCGPYTKLGFIPVPGNLLPKGPVMDMIPMDVAVNNILRKVIREADAFKQLTLYTGAAAQDMQRIQMARDGDAVQVDRMREIQQWISNQPSAALFGLAQAFKQLFSWLGGNMDVIAGLSRQAGTAAQESQMNQNAGVTIAFLQAQTAKATSKVLESIDWLYWHDPTGVMRAEYKLRSDPNISVERSLTPEDRNRIEWEELSVKVDPYSLSSDTPASRVQHMRNLLNTYFPIAPLLQQQGVMFDAQYWLKKEAEYTNNPDIEELFHLGEPTPGESASQDEAGGFTKSPVTSRNYTRTSESEATEDGQLKDAMQSMMGAGSTDVGNFGTPQ